MRTHLKAPLLQTGLVVEAGVEAVAVVWVCKIVLEEIFINNPIMPN